MKKQAKTKMKDDKLDEMLLKTKGETNPKRMGRTGASRITTEEIREMEEKLEITSISFKGENLWEYPDQDWKTKMGRKITLMKQGLRNAPYLLDKFFIQPEDIQINHPNAKIWIMIRDGMMPLMDGLEKNIQNAQTAVYGKPSGFVIPHVKRFMHKIFSQVAVACEADNFYRSVGLVFLAYLKDLFAYMDKTQGEDWMEKMIESTHQENVAVMKEAKRRFGNDVSK